MDFKHKNHLLSCYMSLHKQVQEIRDTIQNGRPPTSNFATLTPLPKGTQNAIMEHLRKVTLLFEELAQRYIASEIEQSRKREPVSATKMWASIQLRQLEEVISDMHPKNFERRFGAIDPQEREYLGRTIDEIIQELKDAQNLV